MSASNTSGVQAAIDTGRPADLTPIVLEADCLESTAPEYLRDLKGGLADAGYLPAELTVEAHFDEDCPIAVQREADRLREYVRVAAFLGAGRLAVDVNAESRPDDIDSALAALEERARREGVTFARRASTDA
ncbi:hypothetical protein ACFQJC_08885 [Haloferax namakaokahaiae]|uniref:DUF7961 domain-containing protein n=1 Tax=Haloferax namakaokahaiae TaxID=1748331 RepID=A0ABD5ZEI3_9EURY